MDEAQSSVIERNCLLIDDPVTQLALRDKYVKINLIKNSSFEGFVHSIDPVTRSIILFVPQTDTHQIILVPGHAIIEVFEIPLPCNITPYIRKLNIIAPKEDITDRKTKLVAWLKQNLLPVSELGDKVVFGNVCILPPYNVTNICTENPIIALQIKKIIGAMPNNFEPVK